MDPLMIALIVAIFTLIVLFSGIPIAFGLSFVSIALLIAFEGFQMLDVFAETFYAGLNSFVLLPSFLTNQPTASPERIETGYWACSKNWLMTLPLQLSMSRIEATKWRPLGFACCSCQGAVLLTPLMAHM